MVERAHVVQAVGELDQNDPDVTRHRDDHLAEILRLLFLTALEGDLRDLGHPIHELRDFGAEICLHFRERRAGVLDHVVQQAGDYRRHVEFELCDYQRDVQRMDYVGLARFALLIEMHPRRIFVRAADQIDVGLRVVTLNPPDKSRELVRSVLR